jgi:hypothetical protein
MTTTGVSGIDDPTLLHVDPRSELVGESESVGCPQRLDILDVVGQWIVIVPDSQIDWNA